VLFGPDGNRDRRQLRRREAGRRGSRRAKLGPDDSRRRTQKPCSALSWPSLAFANQARKFFSTAPQLWRSLCVIYAGWPGDLVECECLHVEGDMRLEVLRNAPSDATVLMHTGGDVQSSRSWRQEARRPRPTFSPSKGDPRKIAITTIAEYAFLE
jgi:hypothetical protein